MRCLKCGSTENIEIGGKIFCARCGELIYVPSKTRNDSPLPEENVYLPEHQVIESEEILHYKAVPLQTPPVAREINFKPLLLILTIVSVIFLIVLSFIFEPFINLRLSILKYTRPVSEIDYFKNKMNFTSQEAKKSWDKESSLIFVDLTKDSPYRPTNFSSHNTYPCIFTSPNKKDEMAIFFVHQKQDKIVGAIKVQRGDLLFLSDISDAGPLPIKKINYLPDQLISVIQINGLDNFLNIYKNTSLTLGPILAFSNKYSTCYWFYLYETSNKKHRFKAKINAENGKILEISQR